jgi:hypothetical protein
LAQSSALHAGQEVRNEGNIGTSGIIWILLTIRYQMNIFSVGANRWFAQKRLGMKDGLAGPV